jgi:MFS family permease
VAWLACALAPTAIVLLAARAMQGLGAASLVPNAPALLSHAYPMKEGAGGRWEFGQRAPACSDLGAADRRRADRTGRLAIDLLAEPTHG